MTAPTTTPRPAEATAPRPGSRAARLLMPRSVDVVKDIATQAGVCTRPLSLRRTDLDTGQTTTIDIPCGATLEAKCPACAVKARKLRRQQIREGWHRDDEPSPGPDPATDDQRGLVVVRAHLEFDRAALFAADLDPETRAEQITAVDQAITDLDEEIIASGLRGRPAPPHGGLDDSGDPVEGSRRVRSTKRRQDAPDLPRRKVERRTVGRTYAGRDGQVFRPSLFLTLTLDSYGRVLDDGTPVNPGSYDYRRAAWDAVHFPALLDRFWQNLRRAVGWNVQYAGAVEPQRRLAPHAHFAIRGTIPRDMLRQVTAATYHQVWWPPLTYTHDPNRPPVWDKNAGGFTDPDTGTPLLTWAEAMDQVDADEDAEPVHVARFGVQMKAEGVLAGSKDSNRCLGYITKYLTKQAADCHVTTTDRQRAHLDRLWQELRFTPCSQRCPNWLLHGVQPTNPKPHQRPGQCKGKVHKPDTLGMGGRRVLISRQWSGKTLADHRADNRDWVKQVLGVTTDTDHAGQPITDGTPSASRFAWELARPTDPDIAPLGHRLLRAISERLQWRNEIDRALRAGPPPEVSATDSRRGSGEAHH